MNILVGILQSLVPSAVAYILGAGYIDAPTLMGAAAILTALGTTLSSALTTVVKK